MIHLKSKYLLDSKDSMKAVCQFFCYVVENVTLCDVFYYFLSLLQIIGCPEGSVGWVGGGWWLGRNASDDHTNKKDTKFSWLPVFPSNDYHDMNFSI